MVGLITGWKKDGKLTDEKEEESWRAAADQFRLPYWDWARKQDYDGNFAIPQVCVLDTVEIILVGGEVNSSFPNPLIGFQNPTGVAMGDESMGANKIQDDIDKKDPSNNLPVRDAPYLFD